MLKIKNVEELSKYLFKSIIIKRVGAPREKGKVIWIGECPSCPGVSSVKWVSYVYIKHQDHFSYYEFYVCTNCHD